MYAARDITNTVGCLGLIVSSIISKKVTGSLYSLPTVYHWAAGGGGAERPRAGRQVGRGLLPGRAGPGGEARRGPGPGRYCRYLIDIVDM